jgi:hypothetical protein
MMQNTLNRWGVDFDRPAVEQSESPVPENAAASAWTQRWPGWIVLWAGWLVPQLVLLGPALVGRTVDIPVDLLALPSMYLPNSVKVVPQHGTELTDLLLCYPQARQFFANELRSGRLPLWSPQNLAGVPFVGWGYSPFEVPYYLVPQPITVAWISLLESITVGLGMRLFLRRCLGLSYWAAALGSWCAPLTGFMTLWHGFSTIVGVCWLPWLLVAIHSAVKRPWCWGNLGVPVVTCFVLLGGHIGIAGLVLLTGGFYAVWLLGEAALKRPWQRVLSSAAGITTGWLLGFAVAAPVFLPLVEYIHTGARMELHAEGFEERPPEGLVALPAIVRPDVYGGNTRANGIRTVPVNLLESSSAAYAGLVGALWLAPLAWCHRRLRTLTVFLTLLILVSLGWTLNVPGIVDVMRSNAMRPLISLSYNRWVFATSDALLILAAIGLDSLLVRSPRFRWWWAIPIGVTTIFLGWSMYRLFTLPRKLDEVGSFSGCLLLGAGLSVLALVGWATTFRAGRRVRWVRWSVVCLLPLELCAFAWGERRQAAIELYFPRVPILERLATLPAGRIWGVDCLHPNLNQLCGLEDVRGYDAVDPRDYTRLLDLACDRESTSFVSYARTLATTPAGRVVNNVLALHPVADLLNVRYLIFRKTPRASLPIILHEDDYWIMENRNALPRAYVPESARVVTSDDEAVAQMAGFEFNPRKTVVMTDNLALPTSMRGTASVHYEAPTRTVLDVEMQTPGLVLLSDSWNPGWNAELDGAACPIYRVDLALRGFQVPSGKHRIVCVYQPQSLRIGLYSAALGGAALLLWWFWTRRMTRIVKPV